MKKEPILISEEISNRAAHSDVNAEGVVYLHGLKLELELVGFIPIIPYSENQVNMAADCSVITELPIGINMNESPVVTPFRIMFPKMGSNSFAIMSKVRRAEKRYELSRKVVTKAHKLIYGPRIRDFIEFNQRIVDADEIYIMNQKSCLSKVGNPSYLVCDELGKVFYEPNDSELEFSRDKGDFAIVTGVYLCLCRYFDVQNGLIRYVVLKPNDLSFDK